MMKTKLLESFSKKFRKFLGNVRVLIFYTREVSILGKVRASRRLLSLLHYRDVIRNYKHQYPDNAFLKQKLTELNKKINKLKKK